MCDSDIKYLNTATSFLNLYCCGFLCCFVIPFCFEHSLMKEDVFKIPKIKGIYTCVSQYVILQNLNSCSILMNYFPTSQPAWQSLKKQAAAQATHFLAKSNFAEGEREIFFSISIFPPMQIQEIQFQESGIHYQLWAKQNKMNETEIEYHIFTVNSVIDI